MSEPLHLRSRVHKLGVNKQPREVTDGAGPVDLLNA